MPTKNQRIRSLLVIYKAMKRSKQARLSLARKAKSQAEAISIVQASPLSAASKIATLYDSEVVKAGDRRRMFATFEDDARRLEDDWKAVGAHLWVAVDEESALETVD
jgi:hypothetical protein